MQTVTRKIRTFSGLASRIIINKTKLRIKYYLRYMDDFILLHHDKDYLESCRLKISSKLAEIQLELHPKKSSKLIF